jgi:hypothetical protein
MSLWTKMTFLWSRIATGVVQSLQLLVEEFKSIFTFWVAGLYNRKNSKVEYTYGWYSASAGIKW